MWLMSAILPNCLRRAPTGSTLIVPTRGVEGAFLIQMNSEIQTIMSAACQLSATPNPKWRCRDALWGHFRANTTSNTHVTVASRSCSPEAARWSLLRVDISGGRECDAHFFLSPPAHLASLSGRSIVFSIADLTVCEFYGTGRAGRISCFLLYRGSARVCRRPYDSLIFLFKLEDRTW